MNWWQILLIALGALLVVTAVHDLAQRKRSILRNFPVVGHLRFVLEAIGPELRQYIFTSNDGERPFSRDQRRWIYSSAKDQNTYFGFGTDNDLEHAPGYLIIKHAPFPILTPPPGHPGDDPDHRLPCAKVLGGSRGRAKAFRMPSVVNISAMSYGSLSGVGIEALNRGAELAGVLHWSGEGGISRHHEHGGDLIWQIGTGYFGCRNPDGSFSPERFDQVIAAHPKIRGVELKLSQGAKPGLGGLLPAAKITKEISEIRGIPMGEDCASPAAHSAFGDIDSMLDFVEMLAERSGLPIGIKSAVGDGGFFDDLARRMARTGRGVDWITVEGRRWDRCRAAHLHRPRGPAVPHRVQPRLPVLRRGRDHRRRGVHRVGPAGPARPGHGRVRARMRRRQRRPGGHVGARVHPVAALPHRSLSHRRGHEQPPTDLGSRPHAQVGAGGALPRPTSQGTGVVVAGMWC